MGIFNVFNIFKKKETTQPMVVPEQRQSTISMRNFLGRDGKAYVEIYFFDAQADFKNFYDTTRLIVAKEPTVLPSGRTVNNAKVSWRNENDVMFWEDGMESMEQMTDIRLRIDFAKLATDGQYQTVLMTQLLNKKRVERYMEQGVQEYSAQPCGNYIGEVGLVKDKQTGREYLGRKFSTSIGREVHALPDQVARRQKHKQDEARKAIAAEKRSQIQKLQSEINDLYR